jgi:hypothetical protein
MKHYTSILMMMLIASALTLLYGAHLSLKYVCEASVHQVESENDQLKGLLMSDVHQTRIDAQRIADLEAKLKVLAAEKSRIN